MFILRRREMDTILNCTGHDLEIPRVVRASGPYVYDDSGRKYMDLESGVWCTVLGHGHPGINAAIKNQVDAHMHAGFCYSNPVLDEAAGEVLSITGFEGGQCVFLCSGSEAIELSRQIASYLTGRKRFMTLADSYLGSYSSATDRTTGWHILDWKECAACPKNATCDRECPKISGIPEDIAAFIFEPGSSSGFVRFPPEGLIRRIVEVLRENGGKIIVNEVTTGIGRTGRWFGYEHYGISPDLVACGKGLGNGYPVSATAISPALAAGLDGTTFRYCQSHQNDPLGASVALEVIRCLKREGLIEKGGRRGPRFLAALESLVDGKRVITARGRGLMFALDLADEETGNRIFTSLLEKGFIVCNRRGLFRIDPPLTITEEEFKSFIEAFRGILANPAFVKSCRSRSG